MAEQVVASVKNSHGKARDESDFASANTAGQPEKARRDPLLASMQPGELRSTMKLLGCPTQVALARAIGVDRSTVSLWLEGRVGVPRPVAKLLRMLVLYDGGAGPDVR